MIDFFKKHPLIKTLAMMLGISIIIVFLAFMFLKIYSRHGKEYDVPELVGQNITALDEVEGANHFDCIAIDSLYMPGKKGGEILTQDPRPHAKAKKGRKVYLTICSFNPENVAIPNLVDLTLRQAVSQLESLGLQGGKITFVSDIANNAILKQSHKGKTIAPGTQISRGSFIDLVVGRGEDASGASVPMVIGKTAFNARKEIIASGLNVGKEYFDANADRTTAKVYKQTPSSTGSRKSAGLGSSVTLWYADPNKKNFTQLAKSATSDAAKQPVDSSEEDADSEALSAGSDW